MSFLGLFKKKISTINFEEVKVGQIYKFVNGYHTKHPYYAEVVEVGNEFFKTAIPNYHALTISESNFDYHSKRMILMGDKKRFGHLIFNQEGLATQPSQEKNTYHENTTRNL